MSPFNQNKVVYADFIDFFDNIHLFFGLVFLLDPDQHSNPDPDANRMQIRNTGAKYTKKALYMAAAQIIIKC
jgi:hypothetical protein